MKGKRKLRERLIAFALIFVMIAGMIIEPVQISAAQPESAVKAAAESREIPQEPQAPEGETEGGENGNPSEATYTISVDEKDGKTEAYAGDTLHFIATLDGKGVPSNPAITWTANGTTLSGTATEVDVTVPSDLQEGETFTVTASIGDVSGSASVIVQVQTYTVKGQIVSSNNQSVSGATVTLRNTNTQDTKTVITDDGSYTFEVPNGSYTLTVERIGFEKYTGNVTVNNADKTSNISMKLASVAATINNNNIVVGESTEATVSGDVEFISVSWASNNAYAATVDSNSGRITGVKAGEAIITPIIESEYGRVPATGVKVTVGECGTKITALSTKETDKWFKKKLIVNVTVGAKDGINSTPTGGKVQFTVKQEEVDEEIEAQVYEEDLKDGKATLELTKKNLDFSGKYTITVQYLGNPGYYAASNSASGEYNYEVGGLTYLDKDGESTSTENNPISLIYGEQKTIWVKEEDAATVNEVISNVSGNINITKKDTSSKSGYTEFLITAIKAGDTCSATFKKINGDESLYSRLYVKVDKKALHIDTTSADKSLMTYYKIYDNDKNVFEKTDTSDDITLNRMSIKADEIVNQGEVEVNLADANEIKGKIDKDFPYNATEEKEEATTITFNQNMLSLTGSGKDNYYLADEEITVPANVMIQKRHVKVIVSNASRSFGHAYNNGIGNEPDYDFKPNDWIYVESGKDITETTGIIEGAYKDPEAKDALLELQEGGNAAVPNVYPDGLSVDTTKFDQNIINIDNYIFDIEEGDLTIKEEEIKDISSYIAFGNSAETPTMYYNTENKLWVKADGGTLKLSPNTDKLYEEVLLKEVGGEVLKEPVLLTKNGYTFSLEEDEKFESKDVELRLQLKDKDGALSKEFSYRIYLDNTIPKVSISKVTEGTKTPLENFVNQISFGAFDKTKYTVQVQVTETETSGLRDWTYMVLPLNEDMVNDTDNQESKLLAYIDTLKDGGEYVWKPMSSSSDPTEVEIVSKKAGDKNFVANNYVVLVKPFDNVTNSKIYTSLGIILDHNDPYIDLGLAEEQEYKEVYDTDVSLHMTITDNNKPADKTVSGLKEVFYQIAIGKEKLDSAEKNYLYQVEDGQKYTLDELQKEVLSRDITVKESWNSNDIWVRVTAVDNSGNEFYAFKQLKIDTVNPEVTVKYETKATEDYKPYYKEDRTAVVTVKERNVDLNNMKELWFDLQCEGEANAVKHTLSSLKAVEGITVDSVKDSEEGRDVSQYTDDRTIEMRIRFHGDNKYNFDVHCTDTAERPNKEDNKEYFVIDKTAPKLNVTYWNQDGTVGVAENEDGRVYSGKPVTTKVEIEEHNFADKDKEVPIDVKVTADKVGKGEEIPDYAALEKTNSLDVWGANGDVYTSTYSFNSDANYTHSITYTDLAGNTVSYGPGYFTVDKTQPTGTVEIKGFGFWESLLEKITFGLFSPSSVDVVMTGADHTSPVNPVQFARFHDQMTRDELESYNGWSSASAEKPDSAAFTVHPDEQFIVYTKVTDYAGNYQYFSSDGMIVDSTKPAPVVTITNLSQSQNGIFNENVTLRIDVEDPTAGETYSGLEKVWYTVSGTGNVNVSDTIELLNNSGNRVQGNKTFSQTITVPADVYNSNDVKVQAFATDFAGNQGDSEVTELKIDVTNPTISVAWDLNNPSNGRYYKDTRTATVTVTDRNFDPNNVRFSITNTDGTSANIGGWSSSSNIGVSDSATSTCQVSFPADGDYTFTLGCTDLAGNSGEYGQTDEFTIDKTVPVMTVSYDNNNARNGNYFKETRTATVTIREHNFNAADVRAAITASLEGRGISTPSVGAFSGSGDTHTARVSYSTDGDYTFDIDYTDMAGNAAADYTQDSFTVDLTAPELEITDVEDKSANNDTVSPKVEATDVNYDAKGVTLTLTGANNGKVEVGTVISAIQNGQSMKFNDFARTEEMDDLYKLTAKVVDKAGNETEKEIMFSVNRYGSVFILDDDTKDWLMTEDGYTYIREEKEVGIREINVDSIESRSITVNRDGELASLKENTDFTVKTSGSEAQWKEAHYTIAKENFAEEGNYTVILNTQDKAQNSMNNTSVKKANKNLPIEFAVDKTAPTVVVSGVEDDAQYRSAEKTMTVDAKDNLALTKVAINIDGTETVYEGEELMKDNGVIEAAIASANRWQSIEITAEDAAGNVLGQSEQKLEGEPVVLRVLVTPNIVIQYYMNKPLFYGSIAAVVVMLGLIIFLVWRKKQQK